MLSCLFPARLGLGRDSQKLVAHDPLGDPDADPFRGNPLPLHRAPNPGHLDIPRARANTVPSDALAPPLLIPNSESPGLSLAPPVRQKRSSFTTFFAFSSKRRSTNGTPVPGRWVGQSQVHVANPASIPSALEADDEEYYYSYSVPLTPTVPFAANRSPSKQLPFRQQDLIGNPDLDSQPSSPVDSHTRIRHPYAYSTPLHPRLRHATSQPFHPQGSSSGPDAGPAHNTVPSSHLGHGTSSHPAELKASMSTPNLASGPPPVRPRSILRKKLSMRSKAQERWLSAETWWDALFSPSPRFKVKRAPRPTPVPDRIVSPVNEPPQAGPSRNLGVTFPSIPVARPRAMSATAANPTSNPTPSLTRSRSAVDLSGRPSASATHCAAFEPALETLVDQPTPPPDRGPSSDSEFPLPDPPLSLEQ